MLKDIKWKPLSISIVISLGVGFLSSLFTMGSFEQYQTINKPVLAPPAWLFPVAWTMLYILMGISAYLVYIKNGNKKAKKEAIIIYGLQLIVNVIWPIIFFSVQNYLFAFVWLVLLFFLIIYMIVLFFRVDKAAAYLQIPYLLWVLFAGYLNLMVYLLN